MIFLLELFLLTELFLFTLGVSLAGWVFVDWLLERRRIRKRRARARFRPSSIGALLTSLAAVAHIVVSTAGRFHKVSHPLAARPKNWQSRTTLN